MRRITYALLTAMLIVFLSPPAFSQDDPRNKLALELLQKMGVRQLIDAAFDATLKAQLDMATRTASISGASPERTKAMEPMFREMSELFKKELSFDVMAPDMAKIYAEAFTVEELRALITFFDSPVGRTFAAKMPDLQNKAMMISQARAMALMPKIAEIAKKHVPKQ